MHGIRTNSESNQAHLEGWPLNQCVCTCADLSTLASVVTTLAAMGKDRESSSGADTSDDVPNGEILAENTGLDQAAKAFDALTKALQPQLDQV